MLVVLDNDLCIVYPPEDSCLDEGYECLKSSLCRDPLIVGMGNKVEKSALCFSETSLWPFMK
jgi:hypothetical protein